MSGSRSSTGLVCGHGSDLDMRIPRAKIPSSALPPEIRAKMGLKPRREVRARARSGANPYSAGAGVVKPRESSDGNYSAGCQKNFLKRGSGRAMSSRASKLAQDKMGARKRTHSTPTAAMSQSRGGGGQGGGRGGERERGRRQNQMVGGGKGDASREETRREEMRRQREVAARRRQLQKE